MIEKLPFTEIHSGGEDMVDRVEFRPVPSYKMQHKINELVDAVNEIMTWRFDYDDETPAENVQPDAKSRPENVQDKFAEQRKWIGKLCKVYDDNDFEHYAVLDEIYDDSSYCYGTRLGNYRHCEPVKPDDDIIYKGE